MKSFIPTYVEPPNSPQGVSAWLPVKSLSQWMIHKLLQGISLGSRGAFRERGQARDSPLGILLFVLDRSPPYLHLRKSPNCPPTRVAPSSETQQIKLMKRVMKKKAS